MKANKSDSKESSKNPIGDDEQQYQFDGIELKAMRDKTTDGKKTVLKHDESFSFSDKVAAAQAVAPPRASNLCYILGSFCLLVLTIGWLAVFQKATKEEVDFDLYILSLSYQPEFCFQHKRDDFPGCRPIGSNDPTANGLVKHDGYRPQFLLTIHGLWPEYGNGSWPSFCTDEPLQNSTISPLKSRLELYWPNVKSWPNATTHEELWEHEWSKHGTCSGLSQSVYFEEALLNYIPTPSLVKDSYGMLLEKELLIRAYSVGSISDDKVAPPNMVVTCKRSKYLSEIRFCLGRKLSKSGSGDSVPTERMPCPLTVLQEDNCDEQIVIAKYPENGPQGNVSSSSKDGGPAATHLE